MRNQDFPVSIRRDFPNLLCSGLLLLDDVDLLCRLERLSGTLRLVQARLVKPGLYLDLSPRRDLDLALLGNDYVNLETEGREMVVVACHFTRLSAEVDRANININIAVGNHELLFVGATGVVGRWDWLVDPKEVASRGVVTVPQPIGSLIQQVAA